MLTRGLRCQANMCEALAVKEFEMKTGLDVSEISTTQNQDSINANFDAAYIKVKGCSHEIKVPMNCSNNGDSFFMSITNNTVRSCKLELSL